MFGGSRRIELNRLAFALSSRVCVFSYLAAWSPFSTRALLSCARAHVSVLSLTLTSSVMSSHLISSRLISSGASTTRTLSGRFSGSSASTRGTRWPGRAGGTSSHRTQPTLLSSSPRGKCLLLRAWSPEPCSRGKYVQNCCSKRVVWRISWLIADILAARSFLRITHWLAFERIAR